MDYKYGKGSDKEKGSPQRDLNFKDIPAPRKKDPKFYFYKNQNIKKPLIEILKEKKEMHKENEQNKENK
ncbi:MAG: hypothetical protein QXF76_02490 [Candidatus Anstonellales archaeon]